MTGALHIGHALTAAIQVNPKIPLRPVCVIIRPVGVTLSRHNSMIIATAGCYDSVLSNVRL